MLLKSVKVAPFRSINTEQSVQVDSKLTVLVGMNEAGKTVFLKALEKSADAAGIENFNPVDDYPRKDLASYLKRHGTNADSVTMLTFEISEHERDELNTALHTSIPSGFTFSVTHKYDNAVALDFSIDERPVLAWIANSAQLSADAKAALEAASTLRKALEALKSLSLNPEDQKFVAALEVRAKATTWTSIIVHEAWQWLSTRRPKFLYFGDYEVLPSKTNLADLAQRVERHKGGDKKALESEHLGVLALLRMADISITDFTNASAGYETQKAKIESVSIRLTDQIMEFWKQNEDLVVEIDIKPDPSDAPPFQQGPNLYLRIKNMRHRGVSTQFKQRSRGFIWFFSFLVWFDDVQQQIAKTDFKGERDLVLLLDEPGLSLHALAQADFLHYIDDLAKRYQVIYTTHSPFMVHMDRLHQIRVVEDKEKVGTTVSANISGADPRTVFPLQAALGWTLAQSLFISKRNLLVEGPADFLYLSAMTSLLESAGRVGLRDDITIVPVGGLDKVATFIALLNGNDLKFAVFHDYAGAPNQRLLELVKQKLVSGKQILNAAEFRASSKSSPDSAPATDLEDLFEPSLYVNYFTLAFAGQLHGAPPTLDVLPAGDRIVGRLDAWLADQDITLRKSGGFNHYAVASCFSQKPPIVDVSTLDRFENLFKRVNTVIG